MGRNPPLGPRLFLFVNLDARVYVANLGRTMKLNMLLAMALAGGSLGVWAQETNPIEQLQRQMEQMQAHFDRIAREQQAQIEALKKEIAELQQGQRAPESPASGLVTKEATATTVSPSPSRASDVSKPWSPADPIRVGGGKGYMDVGIVGTFAAGGSTASDIEGGTQLGGHDPNQRGFTVQGVEANFQGAVDPYFRGNANVLFQIDSGGDSFLELEEAWLETMSLPWNLQVRGGQFLTDFGRINTQHPHSWAFVDTPLVNGRFLGPDGLRNPGARLSWLVPTPFYSELFFAVQNSQGETAYGFRSSDAGEAADGVPFSYRYQDHNRGVKSVGDLLFTPRYALSFDLTESQTIVVGSSAAFGPNSNGGAGDTATQIYGVDLYWKWKPGNAHGGFPFLAWQTEAMLRRYELGAFDWQEEADAGVLPIIDEDTGRPAVLGQETVTDYGFYTQLLYGFRKGWVAGARFDYVTEDLGDYEKRSLSYNGEALGRDPLRNERWRVSPNLTWYPSEFSKIRLQYNYDDRRDVRVDHSVWLQFEFLLGAHAAHKF